MNCGTCKYWDKLEYPVDNRGAPNYDKEEQDPHEWGLCVFASGPQSRTPWRENDPASKLMAVHDASEYRAHLTTRKDFGCVEYDERLCSHEDET